MAVSINRRKGRRWMKAAPRRWKIDHKTKRIIFCTVQHTCTVVPVVPTTSDFHLRPNLWPPIESSISKRNQKYMLSFIVANKTLQTIRWTDSVCISMLLTMKLRWRTMTLEALILLAMMTRQAAPKHHLKAYNKLGERKKEQSFRRLATIFFLDHSIEQSFISMRSGSSLSSSGSTSSALWLCGVRFEG